MEILISIILATLVVSLISFVGVLTLFLKEKVLDNILVYLIALSAGALIGGAFLHLIPEAAEEFESAYLFLFVILGFVTFFLIEKVLHWRHCHKGHCEVHTFAYINLVGDFIHNFIDGAIIAASFIVNVPLGITTTFAIALHEIPQEIGDFGVLIYGGFKRLKALMLNFMIALTSVLGGIVGYFISNYISNAMVFLLPFAAGGFIYIGASDLIPELKKEVDTKKSFTGFFMFLVGLLIMYLSAFRG
jgi:zinc and cadmium transporter